ncbi:MAG TPA: helix-turn-helix domain-containing protein [Actinomycetota bacterium]|nr:helix-turn-helix domain-containing protein [Actinomycetota bacterium]
MSASAETIILNIDERERFLLPAEAARLLGVATSTLRRWAEEGKLQSGSTIGGHRRYRESDIMRLAQGLGLEQVTVG